MSKKKVKTSVKKKAKGKKTVVKKTAPEKRLTVALENKEKVPVRKLTGVVPVSSLGKKGDIVGQKDYETIKLEDDNKRLKKLVAFYRAKVENADRYNSLVEEEIKSLRNRIKFLTDLNSEVNSVLEKFLNSDMANIDKSRNELVDDLLGVFGESYKSQGSKKAYAELNSVKDVFEEIKNYYLK